MINDFNCEIRQHFDNNYENKFDSNDFLDKFNFKKNTFNKNNIDYYFFVVPDKSIICKNFLPINYKNVKRNISSIFDIPDFADVLTFEDYFKLDSHLNYRGGMKLTYSILNHINNSFSYENYINLVYNSSQEIVERYYDLLSKRNWSYSEDEKEKFDLSGKYIIHKSKKIELIEEYPEKFHYCLERQSLYFRNESSFQI